MPDHNTNFILFTRNTVPASPAAPVGSSTETKEDVEPLIKVKETVYYRSAEPASASFPAKNAQQQKQPAQSAPAVPRKLLITNMTMEEEEANEEREISSRYDPDLVRLLKRKTGIRVWCMFIEHTKLIELHFQTLDFKEVRSLLEQFVDTKHIKNCGLHSSLMFNYQRSVIVTLDLSARDALFTGLENMPKSTPLVKMEIDRTVKFRC